MQQLTGLDAAFLYIESANTPMHIAGLAIYDPATAPGGKVGYQQIVDNVYARAVQVPALCSTLKTVPLSLDHPYWQNTGDFDPGYHLRHVTLSAPGNWQQLCELVAQLHGEALDRSHPLWEMTIIDGLDSIDGCPPGCFGVLTKIHHSAVDGAAVNELNMALHDLTPRAESPTLTIKSPADPGPGRLKLLLRAQVNSIKLPYRFASVASKSLPGIAKLAAGVTTGRLHRVAKLPSTRFNRVVSTGRVFGAQTFAFADIRAIKNAVPPATINDVALAIVGGALHKYLLAKDELPQQSMAAAVPINIRVAGTQGSGGNQVSQMTVPVCSHIADPLKRLQAVTKGSHEAKELMGAIGAKTITEFANFMPSTLTASAAKLASNLGFANHTSPTYNCTVTNLPGPQKELYFTGARMLKSIGSGPLTDGNGLFHAVTTYCGSLSIAFLSCPAMMPDPEFYTQCLRESFAELAEVAGVKTETVLEVAAKPASAVKAKTKAKAKAKTKAKTKAKKKTTGAAKPAAGKKAPRRG